MAATTVAADSGAGQIPNGLNLSPFAILLGKRWPRQLSRRAGIEAIIRRSGCDRHLISHQMPSDEGKTIRTVEHAAWNKHMRSALALKPTRADEAVREVRVALADGV